jgi:hypothetical protein
MTPEPTLADLRAVVEAATPGPWHVCPESPVDADSVVVTLGHDPVASAMDEWHDPFFGPSTAVADAAYIATFDPPTVLGLIERVERAEDALARVKREVDAIERAESVARLVSPGQADAMLAAVITLRAALDPAAHEATPNPDREEAAEKPQEAVRATERPLGATNGAETGADASGPQIGSEFCVPDGTGICPKCNERKFIGHGPLCGDCYAAAAPTEGA